MGLTVNWQTYLAFGLYLVFMISVGVFFSKKSSGNVENYLLGGRGLGSWVTAFSAEASDMSGWLLMGLPGAIYLSGMCEAWVAIGLFLGTFFNWIMVGGRLRDYSEATNSLTLISFLDDRVKCPGHLIRLVAGIITIGFFLVYSASGLVAAGKLFESMFAIPYQWAVIVGTIVMLVYILLGGYLAVCWTDFFQGALMFVALIVVPIWAYFQLEPGSISTALEAKNFSTSLIPATFNNLPASQSVPLAMCAIVSAAVWGLGYFGQPHVVVRFMGIKSSKMIPKATIIATIWVFFSLMAAVAIAFVGRGTPAYNFTTAPEAEQVFIRMIGDLFHPFIAGVLLAAIMAAIMSTIDSQLLVCSSAVTSDIYNKFIHRKASENELLWVSRIAVLAIAVIACTLAFDENSSIFSLVKFAWGGFGAAFGPAVLMSLYSRKVSWKGILAGMIAGTAVMLVWKLCWHFDSWMYEILPGFIANFVVVMICNVFWPQKDEEILATFDKVIGQ